MKALATSVVDVGVTLEGLRASLTAPGGHAPRAHWEIVRPVSEGIWSPCTSCSSSRCVPSSNAAPVVRTCAAIWAYCLGNIAMSIQSTGERTGYGQRSQNLCPYMTGFLKARVSTMAQCSWGLPTSPAPERGVPSLACPVARAVIIRGADPWRQGRLPGDRD
jgi:hypothetical protein